MQMPMLSLPSSNTGIERWVPEGTKPGPEDAGSLVPMGLKLVMALTRSSLQLTHGDFPCSNVDFRYCKSQSCTNERIALGIYANLTKLVSTPTNSQRRVS